jgi:KDO2-lipid IV(A) lauroyltransferase
VLHFLGGLFGRLLWLLSATYRRNIRANLTLALGAGQADKLQWRVAAEAGKGVFEMPYMWLRPKADVLAKVRQVDGWDLIEAAWQRGESIVFITPHLGCFEILPKSYSVRAPMTVLYKPPKQAWLRPILDQGRGDDSIHLAPANMTGVRRMLKALKAGEAVGMLPDQVPSAGEGVWLPWFGRLAYTMTLAGRLSDVPKTTVLYAWAQRLPRGAGYHLRVSMPSAPLCGTVEERTIAINADLETLIRSNPEQYQWGYNRYKGTPVA